MSITYPYNLFIIKDNISYKKLEHMSNIFRTIDLTTPKSILENFKLEIDNNFKKNNMTESNTFGILETLSIQFDNDLMNRDIYSLLNTLIDYKNVILLNKSYIDNFMSITKNSINRKIYIENLFYYNPINSNSLEKGFLNNILIDDIINKHSSSLNDINEIKISLDVLIYGDIINLSLPSIGIIDSLDILTTNITFIKFFEAIIKNDNIEGKSIKKNIPFISLNLGNKLADILLNISKNIKFNNINNINYNNTLKKLLSNMINKINVSLEEIYFNDKKIKNEFIIPYYLKKNRLNQIEIEESNKSMIDKIKDFPSLFNNNNELICSVIDDINLDINNIDKKNYKNVLACYLYYIINIGYKILYNYIDKVDDILTNFLNTKDKRFKILNIESAFEYTQLLKESILKFKSILLNNFYNLFLPSDISDGYYGMKLNSNMCYISDEFSFMNDNIFDYYPFNNINIFGTSKIINISNDVLRDFICTINNKKDIYDKFELEFGGLIFDTTIQNNSIKILKEYYNKLQKSNKFNLFIIDKIIYNFNINKSIPFELISDLKLEIETLMKNGPITTNNKNKLERLLLHKYENNLDKSTKFYLKYINEKNKIKISKKTDIHSLYSREELYYLYFNTYFIISNCLYIISDKCISNIKLKNIIIKKFDELKKKYENIIQDYLQK